MADLKPHQTQPLAPSVHHPKSDHVAVHIPYHHHPPPKPASKCFFYTFATFTVVCVLLFVFGLVVLRPKPISLRLAAPALRSLAYDQSSPSFRAVLSATLSIRNPNFAPLRLRSHTLSLRHVDQPVGSSNSTRGKALVAWRSERDVTVDVAAVEAPPPATEGSDEERNRLRDELNSGVLALKGAVEVTGDVVLFNRIRRPAAGRLECDISIDLRSQRLLSFVCNQPNSSCPLSSSMASSS